MIKSSGGNAEQEDEGKSFKEGVPVAFELSRVSSIRFVINGIRCEGYGSHTIDYRKRKTWSAIQIQIFHPFWSHFEEATAASLY